MRFLGLAIAGCALTMGSNAETLRYPNPIGCGETVHILPVYFAEGATFHNLQDEIFDSTFANLRAQLQYVRNCKLSSVIIEGYPNTDLPDASQRQLSFDRARKVREEFVTRGIKRSLIIVRNFSGHTPMMEDYSGSLTSYVLVKIKVGS